MIPTYEEFKHHCEEKAITTIDGNRFYSIQICTLENKNWKRELLRQDGMNQLKSVLKYKEYEIARGTGEHIYLRTIYEYLFDRPASDDITTT
jgi:hypothetical protein